MTPAVRRVALIAHITTSVAWLGAVSAFLALAIAGLISSDATIVRSAYVAMNLIGWYVILPFSLAALVTGLVQSIGTEWGLFRYYWVVVKLLLTIGATGLLPIHLRVTNRLSALAAEHALGLDDMRGMRVQTSGDATAALLVLMIATILSVYKPWGRIESAARTAHQRSTRGRYVLIGLAALVLLMIVLHLAGGRAHPH